MDVQVTAPSGVSPLTSADHYTYQAPPAPTVTSVSPNSGSTAGGTYVEIDGSGFVSGSTTASFGGAAAGTVYVMSSSIIDAYAPAHAAGTVDVTVTNANGTSAASSADQFTYVPPPPPSVTGVSPDTGTTAGGTYVTISGSGFVSGSTTVSFGGTASGMVYVMSGGVIDAYAPTHAAGAVDVTVTTANGTSAVSTADQFTYVLQATTTALASSANPATYGQSVTLTATVSHGGSGYATGTVDFLDGGSVIGTATLSNGQATFATSALAVGGHSLTAAYQGDASNAGSTSAALSQTVQKASTTTTLTSSANPSVFGQTVVFTAEVDGSYGGAPTGTITFMSGQTTLGTASLAPGGNGSVATLALSTLPVGNDSVQAVYGGDANFAGGASAALSQTVQPEPTATSLTTSAEPAASGQAVTFTAEVDGDSGGTPTGQVTFMDGTTTLGTGTLAPGGNGAVATFTTTSLTAGDHTITAVYGGDSTYQSSTSDPLVQAVTQSQPGGGSLYVWTGAVSGNWGDAGNWDINGVQVWTTPGQKDDVEFTTATGGGTDNACQTQQAQGTVGVHSLTIDASYSGTLTLNGELDVLGGGMDMEGGAINQPGGVGVSDITLFGGTLTWGGGVLNSGGVRGALNAAGTLTNITGATKTSGDDFNLGAGDTVNLNLTGSWFFTNNAGMTLTNGAVFNWLGAGNIVTAGTGVILNKGGDFEKLSGGPMQPITNVCDLPYINKSANAVLDVREGVLDFDGSGPTTNMSVYLSDGYIWIRDGATLEADHGLEMDGGNLETPNGATSRISGNVTIRDGNIYVGQTAPSTLICSGFVTWSGGKYWAQVDLTAKTCSLWNAQSFTIHAGVSLSVINWNIPAAGVPSNVSFDIMTAPQGDPAGIDGDIAPALANLTITPTKSYTAGRNATYTAYVLTTP